MPAKKYRIVITEDTLPLITFLNDGVEPRIEKEDLKTATEKQDLWFLFTIESPREITVGRNAIQFEDDLYDENGHTLDEYINYRTLIG